MARGLRLIGHLCASLVALAWFVIARRGSTLVFTHAPDVDARGRDPQMGPLIRQLQAEGEALMEVTLVPLSGGWPVACCGRSGHSSRMPRCSPWQR